MIKNRRKNVVICLHFIKISDSIGNVLKGAHIMDKFEVVDIVSDDHVMAAYINGDPFEALTQIIHNSLDASSDRIDIVIKYNDLGVIEHIKIQDNGCGIKAPNKDDPLDPFLRRGYSEKKIGQINKFNRNMHGKNGDGRFKSYALGAIVEWLTKTKDSTSQVIGEEATPQKFKYVNGIDSSIIRGVTGTIFTALANGRTIKLPKPDELKEKLEKHFLTVIDDARVSIYLNGEKLSVEEHVECSQNDLLDKPYDNVEVKTVIWKQIDHSNNRLFWCDHSYNILREERLETGVQKTSHSLYIASKLVEEEKNKNTLDLISGNPTFSEIEKKARDKKDAFLLQQQKLKTSDIIRKLKEENIYPYNSEASSSAERVTQDLYDKVIVKINEKKPAVFKSQETRKFIVATVKILLEREPEHFTKILESLLNLSSEETAEFSKLLDETKLSNIIKTSRIVSDRLKFMELLRYLVYGDIAKNVKERSQLHKIVEKETWIFGEEYNIITSDKTFNKTIAEIRNKVSGLSEVGEYDGGHRIPDLFFTSNLFYGQDQWALIVELKRPKVKIGKKEAQQIKDYYDIIKEVPEFANWRIDLVIVSSDIDDNVIDGEIKDIRTGLMNYSDKNPLKKIYIKRWGDILDRNNNSLRMLKKALDTDTDEDDGKKYLAENFPHIVIKN